MTDHAKALYDARPQASGDLIERLRNHYPATIRDTAAKVLMREAADALSRPPQPNTVTEEMVEAATKEMLAYVPSGQGPDAENKRLMRIGCRAALTAALATRSPEK